MLSNSSAAEPAYASVPQAPQILIRSPRALQIHAGPRALASLRTRGLRPQDVSLVPAAAGGPKGLVLHPIDRFLFGHWLPRGGHVVHLVGASIGAWRMAAACMADPDRALRRLAHDYIHQDYPHAPGKRPTAADVSRAFNETVRDHFDADAQALLAHPQFRLHVVVSQGRHVLRREGALRTPVGYAGAFLGNALRRSALGAWLRRLVFSDPRTDLPVPLDTLPSTIVPLTTANLTPAILASCSIPFWLQAVHDIPGAPPGACWDGGITDYHLHWAYDRLPATSDGAGLVLYPHFQSQLVPGWLDKAFRARHRATSRLDTVIVVSPRTEWIRSLPGGKLPDRDDFKRYGDDLTARVRSWRAAVQAAEQLAEELAAWIDAGASVAEVQVLT